MVRQGREARRLAAALTALALVAGCGNQASEAQAPQQQVAATGSAPVASDPAVREGFAGLDRKIAPMRRDIAGIARDSGTHTALLIGLLLLSAIGIALALVLLAALKKLRAAMPAAAAKPAKEGMAERQYADLVERLNRIENDLSKLRTRPASAPAARPAAPASAPERSPAPRAATAPVSPIPADQNSQTASTAARPQRAAGSLAQDIVRAFNNIANPKDVEDFESHFGAVSLSNNRNEDATRIFEDLRARFWLIEDPGQPGRGYLIPGADTKKNWHKLKEPKSDHPLGHHFELRPGGDLRIVQPALVQRGADGWQLARKGVLEGMT